VIRQIGVGNRNIVTGDPLFTGREGSRDLLLEFWDLLHISGKAEARKFIFGTLVDHES